MILQVRIIIHDNDILSYIQEERFNSLPPNKGVTIRIRGGLEFFLNKLIGG